jgi:polar amino acid transport system substrate-binding protein
MGEDIMGRILARWSACLVVLSWIGAAQAQTVSLVTGNNYYPYTDERLNGGGLATIYVRTVLEAMGATPEFDFLGWDEGLQAALEGRYAGTFPYIYTEERNELFHYSDPIFSVRPHIFTAARKFGGVGPLNSLRGATLCVPNGWGLDGDLREMLDRGEIKVLTGTNVVGCFRALREAKVHAISIDRRLGTIAARSVDLKYWYIAERLSDEANPHHLIISRRVPNAREWLDQFNATLNRLQSEGVMYDITSEFYESLE